MRKSDLGAMQEESLFVSLETETAAAQFTENRVDFHRMQKIEVDQINQVREMMLDVEIRSSHTHTTSHQQHSKVESALTRLILRNETRRCQNRTYFK